jgi:hypothetical protein
VFDSIYIGGVIVEGRPEHQTRFAMGMATALFKPYPGAQDKVSFCSAPGKMKSIARAPYVPARSCYPVSLFSRKILEVALMDCLANVAMAGKNFADLLLGNR